MESAQLGRLIAAADDQRIRGNLDAAIETLRRVLSIDPEHARAHASLAIALVDADRLHAAEAEVGAALLADGNDAYCHYAGAFVCLAQRRLDDAWKHCMVALEESENVPALVLASSVQRLRGDAARAREQLGRALELAPADPHVLRELARLELADRDFGAAARAIDDALRASPESVESHVLAGHIALARGDQEAADRHLRIALQARPDRREVIQLLASVKARRSPLLGPWWRFNSWIAQGSGTRTTALLIATFILVRVAIIVADHFDADRLAAGLHLAWLGFCAYTWVGPALWRRMVQQELQTVRLRDDY
jgi:Tfp pilus assembly protein PilF